MQCMYKHMLTLISVPFLVLLGRSSVAASEEDCTDWNHLASALSTYDQNLLPSVPSEPLALSLDYWPDPFVAFPAVYETTYESKRDEISSEEAAEFKHTCNSSVLDWGSGVSMGPMVTGSGLYIDDTTYCRVSVAENGGLK